MKTLLIILFGVLAFSSVHLADTLYVPSQYQTIQSAINASVHGDLVLVSDGTYYENIKFNGKKITVASRFIIDGSNLHIDNTVINGSQPSFFPSASVVAFVNDEDTNSVICGFTLTGGTGNQVTYVYWPAAIGGGIYSTTGCKIINNKIIANNLNNTYPDGAALGGGIACLLGNNEPVIIRDNERFVTIQSLQNDAAAAAGFLLTATAVIL